MSVFLCGGDLRPGKRGTDCPNILHDHPLPDGYTDAAEVAAKRLRYGGMNPKCPKCGLYGWTPGTPLGDGSDTTTTQRANTDE